MPHTTPVRMRPCAGFTLIELLVSVGLVAILAAVSYPSYADYVRRAQVLEAMTVLSDYRVKMEQYFQDARSYGTAPGGPCANGADAPPWASFVPKIGQPSFTYACLVTNQGYTITATGNSGRAAGNVYTVDQDNQQKTTWFRGRPVEKGCWLQKGSEC